MDESSLKQLAKRLHAALQPQLGPAFKHSHALDLIAALPGLRDWKEARARKDTLAQTKLTIESVTRVCRRLAERYDQRLDPQRLLEEWTQKDFTTYRPVIKTGTPTRWVCDMCGDFIDSFERGYVIWKSAAGQPYHDFKIVHQSKCDPDGDFDCSGALSDFLGIDGLNHALSYLSAGALQAPFERGPRSSTPNLDEFTDLIRRVQVPYYDLARPYFKNPRVIDDFRGMEVMAFSPEILKRIAEDPRYHD